MRKISLILAVLGAGAAVALGARKAFLEKAAAPDDAGAPVVVPVEAEAPAADTAPATEAPSLEPAAGTVEVEVVESTPPAQERTAEPVAERPRPAAPAEPSRAPAPAEAQEPDAAAILTRVSDAFSRLGSLQAEFEQRVRNPLIRADITSRGTLYQRRPDRFLMRFSDPEGDVIVSDGRSFWVYYPSVDANQVYRMPAGAGGATVDLQAQFLGNPHERFSPEYAGKEKVRGREAWILVLTPRENLGYQRLKVWVDVQDALVRRFEILEQDGRVRHFELFDLVKNPRLEDSLFEFVPPEGARIIDRS